MLKFGQFHRFKPSPKSDYIEDLNELIVELTGDNANRLTQAERLPRGDIYLLIEVLEDAAKRKRDDVRLR